MHKIENVFVKLMAFDCKEDGTYDFCTGESVSYESGYQVSFVRPEAFEQLHKEDWDTLTNYLCLYLESKAHWCIWRKRRNFLSLPRQREISRDNGKV